MSGKNCPLCCQTFPSLSATECKHTPQWSFLSGGLSVSVGWGMITLTECINDWIMSINTWNRLISEFCTIRIIVPLPLKCFKKSLPWTWCPLPPSFSVSLPPSFSFLPFSYLPFLSHLLHFLISPVSSLFYHICLAKWNYLTLCSFRESSVFYSPWVKRHTSRSQGRECTYGDANAGCVSTPPFLKEKNIYI